MNSLPRPEGARRRDHATLFTDESELIHKLFLKDTYNLVVGDYHGGLGEVDSLAYHNGRPFSTPDKDNDEWVGNCSKRFKGAWW